MADAFGGGLVGAGDRTVGSRLSNEAMVIAFSLKLTMVVILRNVLTCYVVCFVLGIFASSSF